MALVQTRQRRLASAFQCCAACSLHAALPKPATPDANLPCLRTVLHAASATHPPTPPPLVASVPQLLLAAAIIALVATKLDDVTLEGGQLKEATQASCTLGASTSSASLCTYVYTTASVSLAVSLALTLAMCLTCNM